jgi:drug/metabolite transporter (DMT)-like permease
MIKQPPRGFAENFMPYLLMGIAVVLYGLYSALLRRRPAAYPLSILAATFALGRSRPFARLPCRTYRHRPVSAQPRHRSKLAVCGAPSVHRRLFLLEQGVDLVGLNRAGFFINLIPAFASLLSVWLLDESIHLFHVGGMGFIAGGMALFYRAKA